MFRSRTINVKINHFTNVCAYRTVIKRHLLKYYIIIIIIIITIIIITIIIIIIIIIEITHSKTILENTIAIAPQPVGLDFKNLSQYSSRSKKNCLLNLCRNTAVIPICFNLLPNSLGIALKDPTTNGMIFTLIFHIFYNSLPKS